MLCRRRLGFLPNRMGLFGRFLFRAFTYRLSFPAFALDSLTPSALLSFGAWLCSLCLPGPFLTASEVPNDPARKVRKQLGVAGIVPALAVRGKSNESPWFDYWRGLATQLRGDEGSEILSRVDHSALWRSHAL